MNNKKCQDSDRVGRKIALSYLQKEYPEFTFEEMQGEFDNWDLEVTNYDHGSVLIECKNRRIPSNKYDTIFLDEYKIKQCQKEMMFRKKKYGEDEELIFCATFADGVCKLWDIKGLIQQKKFTKGKQNVPVCTEDLSRGYELQDVIYFKHSDAFKVIKK